MPTAIEFEHIGKQYRLGLVSTGTLSHDLNRWWQTSVLRREDPYLKIGSVNDRTKAADSDYVWALRDINFQVGQGDVVGIIGKNGAGKSTLLKLLSKVTAPTVGTIRARGRIASLLEVGTGFHGEMTGRENIYLNGAIMGMTRQEITRKLDEIVDFSGCERYLDTPVKRYSSGMTVRLGFAVAAHLDPEILVVDEVLAVGDAEFQKKAIGKMQDISHTQGRTVLFVSHNMGAVRNLCQKGILLDNGELVLQGAINDVVGEYISKNASDLVGEVEITESQHVPNQSRELEYVHIKMLNDVHYVSTEEPLQFIAKVRRNNSNVKKCQFGVIVRDEMELGIAGMYSNLVDLPEGDDLFEVRITLPYHQLARGKYVLNFNVSHFDGSANVRDYDIVTKVISFEVNYLDKEHCQPFVVWPRVGRVAYQHGEVTVTPFKKD